MRRVVSFIGGLDLTDGRYDNPEHSLFSTLKVGGVHNGDFYQPSVEGKQPGAGAVFGGGQATPGCRSQHLHAVSASADPDSAQEMLLRCC